MQWLETTFLTYLKNWEHTVKKREVFTASQKKNMLLSATTSKGLKITGMGEKTTL